MTTELSSQSVDKRVSLYQAIAELCPLLGPFVSRLIGEIIPNQRVDRIADVVRRLEEELKKLMEEEIKRKEEQEFIDLFEEGLYQATRAASPERREYIAKILKNGLTSDRADLVRERRLMMLLGDLNDLEVVLLQFYNAIDIDDKESVDRLRDTAVEPSVLRGSDPSKLELAVLHRSHRDRLSQLGLLRPNFPHLKKHEIPEFDRNSGTFKPSSYKISPLGRLLMKAIDQRTIYDTENTDTHEQPRA